MVNSAKLFSQTSPIDAVITWVDGRDTAYAARRQDCIAGTTAPLENAVNPHRWTDNDEIQFCLRAIAYHAPWVRRIHIVSNGGLPNLTHLPAEVRAKVRHVPHATLFQELPEALPTFNSLSIETRLAHVPDLAEHFLYFNDDVFLTSPLHPQDVFWDGRPVLRGRWVDYAAILADPATPSNPARFNHVMQANAAALLGVPVSRLFAAAHVVHPLCRSVLLDLAARFPDAYRQNARHPLRALSQFLPQGAHNHACLLAGQAVVHPHKDYVHVKSGKYAGKSAEAVRTRLQRRMAGEVRFLCVNDLPQLEAVFPDARAWLTQVTGPHAIAAQ